MRDYAVALWGIWRPRPDGARDLGACRILLKSEQDAGCVAVQREMDHLWVDSLYVAPRCQNRGIGSQALRVVLSEAASLGCPIRLSVLTTNPALAFYLRHGLVIERETPECRHLTTAL